MNILNNIFKVWGMGLALNLGSQTYFDTFF